MSKSSLSKRLIRALFIDLDGTLIGKDEIVSPRVRHALEAARAAGCEIVVSTGRTRFTAQPIAEQIPPLSYAVVSNGGVVVHLDTNEVLHNLRLPIPLALEVVRAIAEYGATPYIYEDSTIYEVENSRVLFPPGSEIGVFATPPRYRPHSELTTSLPFVPISVSTFGPKEHIRPLLPILRERLGDAFSFVQSGNEITWGIEIYRAGITKQVGAERLLSHLGIAREATLAIGDHHNDVELLRWAGIGVAMGNAEPETVEAADVQVGTLAEDGVAEAIERFIL